MSRIVLVHGCFDILHVGHIRHFKEAREFGDMLVVSVSPDHVVARKGPGRPVYSLDERLEVLSALRIIDCVWAAKGETGAESIRSIRPQVFCKGVDYRERGLRPEEVAACKLVGAEIRFTASEKRSVREDAQCVFL